MKIVVRCNNCGNTIERYPSQVKKRNKFFCDKICDSEFNIGSNNPNYGNKWSEEQRFAQSQLIKTKVTDEYRQKAGSANRGKKFSKDRIRGMHGHRTKESYSRLLSEETKRKIGQKSKEKFTPEYNKKIRKQFEELGYWIPLENLDDKIIYYRLSDWIDKMFDLVENEEQLKLLSEKRLFHSKKNSKGVVRDHAYSRHSGFINKVFPEILRHPCNLQIITHSDNVKKRRGRYIDADVITLNELFKKIGCYKHYWKEHKLVLSLIERYINGERWSR